MINYVCRYEALSTFWTLQEGDQYWTSACIQWLFVWRYSAPLFWNDVEVTAAQLRSDRPLTQQVVIMVSLSIPHAVPANALRTLFLLLTLALMLVGGDMKQDVESDLEIPWVSNSGNDVAFQIQFSFSYLRPFDFPLDLETDGRNFLFRKKSTKGVR